MVLKCKYIVWIYMCVVGSLQPPRLDISFISETSLKILCYVNDNKPGPREIYRMNNNNYNLIVTVIQSDTQCKVTSVFQTDIINCTCEGTYLVQCNITDIRKTHTGGTLTCATYQNGIPVFSNAVSVYNSDSSDNKKMSLVEVIPTLSKMFDEKTFKQDITVPVNEHGNNKGTTFTVRHDNSIIPKTTLTMSTQHAETTSRDSFYETREKTSTERVLHTTDTSLKKTDEQMGINAPTDPGGNDAFYKKFIIIVIASAVVVVVIAASLLIVIYRKYHHLSEAPNTFVGHTETTSQRINTQIPEDVPENRQSTVEIYETIPIIMLSPLADCFPLPQGTHSIVESESDSSVGSEHNYESVPDYQNDDLASSNRDEAVSNSHPSSDVIYESLLGARTYGTLQNNT